MGAYKVESIKLFRLIIFNYLVSNGDAHLKNFSLIETETGDYILSPAYDLICSRLHVDDTDIALYDGLFADDYETESFKANGFYAYDDFFELGKKAELPQKIIREELEKFISKEKAVHEFVGRSFLAEEFKFNYLKLFRRKQKALGYSMTGVR